MLTSAMTGPLHVKQTHLKAKDGAALSGDASRVSGTDYIRWWTSHDSEKEQWGHKNLHNKQQEAIGLRTNFSNHSSKASILQRLAFFIVQLSHPYMTTGKTIVLTRQTFVGKVMSLLFNMLSRLVITFLPRSKRLLISWLQSPPAVI